ncbi:MAG TPA: lyase family protein [Usitatibacter sp.]|nr:lyase family protein [Usitatibacter sp.]
MAGSLASRTLARPSFETAFEPPAFLRAMLAFEAALARAEAAEHVIPHAAADAIVRACASVAIDVEALVAEGKRSATLVVPLVNALRAEVARASKEHARLAHFGSTTQDVMDTAMVLCLRPCLEEADRTLEAAVRSLAARAREHRDTPMLGRTLMQPAVPMTAGLKLARWAAALAKDRERLAEAAGAALAVQLGGAVGGLEVFGEKGPAIRHRIALELGLADGPAWHSHRNAWIDLLSRVGQVVATAGKIAHDVSLMAQPEVGEMLEAPPRDGVGVSSAMPHKRTPVGCVHALASAARMPGLLATLYGAAVSEHERALGGWQAELALVPEIASALGTSLDFLDTISASLVIHADRMRDNIARYSEPSSARFDTAVDELLGELAPYFS